MVNSGKRVSGSKVNLFVITGHSSEETSQLYSLGGIRSGVCCASHHSLIFYKFIRALIHIITYGQMDTSLSVKDRRSISSSIFVADKKNDYSQIIRINCFDLIA